MDVRLRACDFTPLLDPPIPAVDHGGGRLELTGNRLLVER